MLDFSCLGLQVVWLLQLNVQDKLVQVVASYVVVADRLGRASQTLSRLLLSLLVNGVENRTLSNASISVLVDRVFIRTEGVLQNAVPLLLNHVVVLSFAFAVLLLVHFFSADHSVNLLN